MYSPLQLLLLDDDAVDRMATRRSLQAADLELEITEAEDVPEALAILRSRPFDCVLSDYHLPQGDGLSLFRRARELGIDCPFIVLTGHGHEQIAVEIMKAGVADYLVKAAATPDRLGHAVRRATRVHHAERLRAEAQERQRSYAAQLKGLAEASIAINSTHSLDALLTILTDKAAQLVGAHQSVTSVAVGADWSRAITAVHLSDKYARYRDALQKPDGSGLYALVCAQNQPIRLSQSELENHPRYRRAGAESAAHPPLRGWLAAPLVGRNGDNLGLLQLSDKYEGEFSEADEAVLVQLARIGSLAIENAQLLDREKRARQHAEASAARIARLQAVTAALSQPADEAQVARIIVEQAEAALGAERVALYFAREERELVLAASRNLPGDVAARLHKIPLSEAYLATNCVREARPLYIESFDRYEVEAAQAAQAGIWSPRTAAALAGPLQLDGGPPMGAIAMTFAHKRSFQQDERTYFESLSDQWAQALDRARLHASERVARRQAEVAREQAETANRLKDEFLATISHELRTPLQSVLGWARLLRGHTLDARTEKGLEVIERNARAQAQLIEDILDVSRIITGKLRLTPRSVLVESFVQAAVDTLRAAAEAKHITIVTDIDPDAGETVGDPDRLQQVVWNLLSNAVKFTPQGGRIEVRVERDDEAVSIHVTDSGRGIPAEFLPHVFERFRQADASTTRSHSGLGLGLAIVRHLTELHGGRVSAESDGAGHGATFIVRLPVRSTLPPPAPEQVAPLAPDRVSILNVAELLSGRRVLVVDDENDVRELTSTVIAQGGALVSSAVSAAEALEKLHDFRPDLVVSDIAMPGEDGFTLLRRIRALEGSLGRVPVIALTAFARVEDRTRVVQAGFDRHLAKPVDPQVLLATIGAVLAARSAEVVP